jgi:hypothetical protein
MHKQGRSVEIQNSNTLQPVLQQHDSHVTSVIAQQYSSATFVSLLFHSHKEKFSVLFINVIP